MNIIRFIKEKWNNWYYHDLDEDDDKDEEDLDWNIEKMLDEQSTPKHKLAVDDEDARTVYVLECLGQMAEAAEKMEVCDSEYKAVTDLLMDIEEIEALQGPIKNDLMNCSNKIENLEKERHKNYSDTELLSEEELEIMERNRDSIPEGIKKIREEENYRKLIKHDLKKLNAQKKALSVRRNNLNSTIANSRGIAVICGVSILLCMVMLMVLDHKFDMDVRIGYVLTGGIGALALTFVYLRYLEANREIEGMMKNVNKLISVHNTVKIRYVNNTNLLQYLYMKYDVDSSGELEDKWNVFMTEEAARQKDDVIKEELDYYYNKLTEILVKNNIKDPEIWLGQTKALFDHKEMVEVRHALIGRRQKLREQMEYNKKIATSAKDNIANLAKKYPQYSAHISQIVDRYDGKN